MKATIYVPKQIHIPDKELPRLARLAAAKRRRTGGQKPSEWPIDVHELIQQAQRVGLIVADDISLNGDDDRYWFRGEVRGSDEIPWKELLK